jgi:ligand-binding sensor domain-containing protein/serine phosphatase RsbU (regulator of sigma subunit)
MPSGKLGALARAALAGTAFGLASWGGVASALDPARAPSQYVSHLWMQTADGLPQNFVAALAQTLDGYVWLATQEGVVRFDGVRFVTFASRDYPALKTNDIAALIADRGGGLWIGSRGGGLIHEANGVFTAYRQKDGLANDIVLSLHEAKDGAIWAGTRGGGVSRFEGGRFTTLRVGDGLASNTVQAMAERPGGTMWLGTDAGLSRYEGDHFTTMREGLSDPSVNALLQDPDGTLWIGTQAGLDRWQGDSHASLPDVGAVHALLRDRQGNLWIGAQEGIRRLVAGGGAAGEATPFGALTKLDGDGSHRFETSAFLEDREGNLWAGLEANGLVQLQDGKVTTFGTEFLWTIFQDPRGTLWLGGDPGLDLLEGDTLRPVPAVASLSVNGVTDGPDGSLWLATTRGLYAFRDGKLLGDAVAAGSVRSLYRDTRGAVWFGTSFGLARYDHGQVTRFTPADGVPMAEVRAFAEGRDGSVWMGTGQGLLHWKDGAFSLLTAKDGLPDEPVESIYADPDGDLWIGSYGGGLVLLREGKIGLVTSKNGLFNDVVFSVVDDGMGSLWMTCNRGIFHAGKSELAAVATGAQTRLTSVALGTSDGMKASECNSGSPGGVRARDGLLWFPTTVGAVRVDPGRTRKNLVVPPVLIEEVRVNREPLRAGARELPADSRDFELVYTALSFTAPERVRFKYRLDGFDKDWIDAGARRIAYYTNLAPGAYAFRVIAANDDGIWNDVGAEVRFVLLPHFYQTLPFYLACALGLVLLGAGSVRLRLLALRQTARELEAKVEKRTQELAKASAELEGAFHALAEKDRRLHEDLLQARAFQEKILPRLPSGGAIRFRAVYRPADLVGGDVYDVSEIAPGHFRVFVADTTGHGVQASLRTMVLKTEYDRVKLAPEGPGRVLADLNRKLAVVYPDLEMRCSACCFDVVADEEGATLRYANAAHPPLLRVSGTQVEEIEAGGTFLGMVADATFREHQLRLEPKDRLVAYTDGICEQEDDGGRAFGVERMEELLATRVRDADEVVRDLDAALTAFMKGRPLEDDMVLVCVEFAGERRSMVSVSDDSEYKLPVPARGSGGQGSGERS